MTAPPPATTELPDLDELVALVPFAAGNGVRLTALSRGAVTGELDWAPDRCTVGGVMHGGALMLLADTVGAVAAFLHLPEGAGTATITSSTQFVGAVREGTVVATSTVEHAGRSVVHVHTRLTCGDRLVATTSQAQAVR